MNLLKVADEINLSVRHLNVFNSVGFCRALQQESKLVNYVCWDRYFKNSLWYMCFAISCHTFGTEQLCALKNVYTWDTFLRAHNCSFPKVWQLKCPDFVVFNSVGLCRALQQESKLVNFIRIDIFIIKTFFDRQISSPFQLSHFWNGTIMSYHRLIT